MRRSSKTLLIASLATALTFSYSSLMADALFISADNPLNINIELASGPISTSTVYLSSSGQTSNFRYYFVDQPWWNADDAATAIVLYRYAPNGPSPITATLGPVYMTELVSARKGSGTTLQKTWYYDCNLDYYNFVFILYRYKSDDLTTTGDLNSYINFYHSEATGTVAGTVNTIYLSSEPFTGTATSGTHTVSPGIVDYSAYY